MAGRLVEHINRLIRSGIDNITEQSGDERAQIRQEHSERALLLVRDKLGQLVVERRRLERLIADLPADVETLSGKAELALRKGREDLAVAAVDAAARLEDGRRETESAIASLDADIALLENAIRQLSDANRSASPDQSDRVGLRALLAELDRLAGAPQNREKQGRES